MLLLLFSVSLFVGLTEDFHVTDTIRQPPFHRFERFADLETTLVVFQTAKGFQSLLLDQDLVVRRLVGMNDRLLREEREKDGQQPSAIFQYHELSGDLVSRTGLDVIGAAGSFFGIQVLFTVFRPDDFTDTNAVSFIDNHDFAAAHQAPADQDIHGFANDLVEFHDGAGFHR